MNHFGITLGIYMPNGKCNAYNFALGPVQAGSGGGMLDFNENPAIKTSSGLGTEPVQVECKHGATRAPESIWGHLGMTFGI